MLSRARYRGTRMHQGVFPKVGDMTSWLAGGVRVRTNPYPPAASSLFLIIYQKVNSSRMAIPDILVFSGRRD